MYMAVNAKHITRPTLFSSRHLLEHKYSTSAYSELDPSNPCLTVTLTYEEEQFANKIGFKVAEQQPSLDSSPVANEERGCGTDEDEGDKVTPSFIIQMLTHKSYKAGRVPTNEKLVYLGRTFLESAYPVYEYKNILPTEPLSLKPLLETQTTLFSFPTIKRLVSELKTDTVTRWDIVT